MTKKEKSISSGFCMNYLKLFEQNGFELNMLAKTRNSLER